MAFTTYTFRLTLSGATGNQDSPRSYAGKLISVAFKSSGVPGTTVVTLTTKGTNGPAQTLLVTPAGSQNNAIYYPEQPSVKSTDGSAITTWFEQAMVDDFINVAAASSGAGTIDVYLGMQVEGL